MVENLIDNIYVTFVGLIFQQVIGIPLGTNCAPLLPFYFILYETEFLDRLMGMWKWYLASIFNLTPCFIDDLISLNNSKFGQYLTDF